MNSALRILNVEDNLLDRELIATALHRDGLVCEFVYATTESELRQALEQSPFDVILSDFTLPTFTGAEVAPIARALRPEIPFIFVSCTIGEVRAVEALKEGATDYVL